MSVSERVRAATGIWNGTNRLIFPGAPPRDVASIAVVALVAQGQFSTLSYTWSFDGQPQDGLLLIGEAAHAMSPVGGVGINLAVADAVAAARLLAPALRSGGLVPRSVLRKVQQRRWWPTALVQGAQRIAHRAILGPVIAAGTPSPTGAVGMADDGGLAPAPLASLPFPLRMLQRFPVLQGIPARLVAIGPLPEHAPDWARRAPEPAARP